MSVPRCDLAEMVRDVKYDIVLYHDYLRQFPTAEHNSKAKALEDAYKDLYILKNREQVGNHV